MEKFEEIEIEPEQPSAEEKPKHSGLERLEQELKRDQREIKKAEVPKSKIETKQLPSNDLKELESSALNMQGYAPEAWDELKERSRETYEKALQAKSEDLAQRYLTGTATLAEKDLLEKLRSHNHSELTDILLKDIRNAAKTPETLMACADPKKIAAAKLWNKESLEKTLEAAMSEAEKSLLKRFEKIAELEKQKTEPGIDLQDWANNLSQEREICEKSLENIKAIYGTTLFKAKWKKMAATAATPIATAGVVSLGILLGTETSQVIAAGAGQLGLVASFVVGVAIDMLFSKPSRMQENDFYKRMQKKYRLALQGR